MAKGIRAAQGSQSAHQAPGTNADANLLITIDERHRAGAESQVIALLKAAGYPRAALTEAPATGLIGVHVAVADSRDVIPKIHALFLEKPFAFQNTHRWLPVEAWANADAAELRKFAKIAGAEIQPKESWGIVLEQRDSMLDRDQVLGALAQDIGNERVKLDGPDKTLFVEVCGERAGMAVLDAHQILSVDRALRDEFVEFREVSSR